jgi:hypothetical protein
MEVWKDVKNYEDYYIVSNYGVVMSKGRMVKPKNRSEYYINPRIMSQCNSHGYKYVCLTINGKTSIRSVHSVVAEAFLNHTSKGFKLVVDHIDNDKTNNFVGNLRIITSRHNTAIGHKNTSSKYIGVCWHKSNKKWMASVNKKFLGYFNCELKAYQSILNYEKENKNLQKLPR